MARLDVSRATTDRRVVPRFRNVPLKHWKRSPTDDHDLLSPLDPGAVFAVRHHFRPVVDRARRVRRRRVSVEVGTVWTLIDEEIRPGPWFEGVVRGGVIIIPRVSFVGRTGQSRRVTGTTYSQKHRLHNKIVTYYYCSDVGNDYYL